jgi:putative hydrolase of the HAD superfamily
VPAVVTFDAGQTLVELDLDFLARRLVGRGVFVSVSSLAAALAPAWRHHDELAVAGHGRLWHALIAELLRGAGIADVGPLVDWLWAEQPRANLFRRPIPGMVELARELGASGARVGVISNSEGRLAELFAEIGIADAFEVIVDSGVVGIEKPDRRIFDHALARLGGGDTRVHIGDSWAADVCGALAAGWRAVWFGRRVTEVDDPRVTVARDATELRAVLSLG